MHNGCPVTVTSAPPAPVSASISTSARSPTFSLPAFAFELDRHAGYSQDLADVRGQTRRVPATLARKNREQPVPLLFGGACVKVQGGFPLDFMHSARRIDGQRNIQPRQIGGAVLAGIDMPADHHRAVALGWCAQEDAGTRRFTIARF